MALVEITRLDWSVARLRAEMARTADAAHFDIRRHARGAGKLRQAPVDQARPAVHLGEAGQRLRRRRGLAGLAQRHELDAPFANVRKIPCQIYQCGRAQFARLLA
jgi:hypothetical protein